MIEDAFWLAIRTLLLIVALILCGVGCVALAGLWKAFVWILSH